MQTVSPSPHPGQPRFHIAVGMPCKLCGSVKQRKFSAEVSMHFLGLHNIDEPVVWVFPKVVVCLDCGTAEFVVPTADLRQLAKGEAAAGG